jgi:hypothetical protein
VVAELAVFADRPRDWLKFGPGKEQPHSPGWASAMKPIIAQLNNVNVLASPEWNALWSVILATIAPYPEARAALADALAQFNSSGKWRPAPAALPAPPAEGGPPQAPE